VSIARSSYKWRRLYKGRKDLMRSLVKRKAA